MYTSLELSTADNLQHSSKEEMDDVNKLRRELLELEDSTTSHFRDGFRELFKSLTKDSLATLGAEWVPTHRPHHDVESLFWVLCYSLARALPFGADHRRGPSLDGFCRSLLDHAVPLCPSSSDPRDVYLDATSHTWARLLHPRLRSFYNMLSLMGVLFRISWSRRIKDAKCRVVHQAFKRLLFNEIWRMTQAGSQELRDKGAPGAITEAWIRLDTTQPRKAHVP